MGSGELIEHLNNSDVIGVFGKEKGIFHRRVPATYHDDRFSSVERTVADCAGGDSLTPVGIFAWHLKLTWRSAGGYDKGTGFQDAIV